MVNPNIRNVIANMNKEFVSDVVNGTPISKEELKNFIVDMLRECDDDECEWIQKRLIEGD